MKSFLSKNWKTILGTAIVGSLAYILLKNKKEEGTSGFLGSPIGKVVQFTLVNNTAQEQETTLFNSFTNYSNPNVGVSSNNMSSSEFNRSLLSEPIKINNIEVRCNGANGFNQSQKVITKICKDASGVSNTEFYYPMVSPNQFQPNMTSVQPANLILDGVCYLKYSIAPNTTVTLVFNYDVTSKNITPMVISNVHLEKNKPKRKKKKSFFRW